MRFMNSNEKNIIIISFFIISYIVNASSYHPEYAKVMKKNYYDSGIHVMKIDLNDKNQSKLTVFRSNPQNSYDNYEPIKCEDQ